MLLDNELITNRPKQLLEIEYYLQLPSISIQFNYASLPSYLNVDLLQLFGIMPKTRDLVDKTQVHFLIQPSEKEVEYYRQRNSRFQMINVVASIYSFKKVNDDLVTAYPYSISLVAGPKRGKPDECSIDLLNKLDLEEVSQQRHIFTDFSPYKPVDTGFFADISFLAGATFQYYTDTIGFVLEKYFLPTDVDLNDALLSGPTSHNELIYEKFRKYRIKRYFKPFDEIKPRKIWGCDSPIELFLVQALAQKNLFPVIQTLIFKDGEVYDNFFEMVKEDVFKEGDGLITEVDLFFPIEKLAVFCDSVKYHRGKKNKARDTSIDDRLSSLGIRSLRLRGNEIVKSISDCVNRICDVL